MTTGSLSLDGSCCLADSPRLQRDKWKASLEEMKAIFRQVEEEGFEDVKAWRIHWDHQLFKALDYQYKLGLESCHETLPQIEAKLVFKGRKLGWEK